jgi:hypothetical protein
MPRSRDRFAAALYPAKPPSAPPRPVFGVCVSGGGSRALTCALGQLSALRTLADPADPSRTLLERADHLSAVSGGSWASVLYTFLPLTIAGQPVSDDDFLITPTAPQGLSKADAHTPGPGNVSWLHRFSLGTAPQQFDPSRIVEVLYRLYRWGFFDHEARWPWFWIAAVGEIILRPFELYDGTYDRAKDFLEPARSFSLSADHVRRTITPANPSLGPDDFYLARDGRTPLLVNCNILQQVTQVDSPQVPVQATPIDSGVRGRSPDGALVGGGGVESFGFTSTLLGPGDTAGTAAVALPRRYSLCDAAGCSSAFFAAMLLQYLNDEIVKLTDELERFLTRKLHVAWLARWVARRVLAKLEPFLDTRADRLIPRYDYWPLGAVGVEPATSTVVGFSDGGDFDNTGLLGLLARTDADRAVSFVNSETPLSRDAASGEILLAGQLALLFGYQAGPVDGRWVSYGGMSPQHPLSYVQVFDDAGGAFAALRQGLYEASCGGAGRDGDLGTDPAVLLQDLTTVDNPVAGIAGGRRVRVLWVYNNRVNAWQDALADAALRADLERAQSNQHRDGTPIDPHGAGTGPVANFPWYFTGDQIHLDPEGVNMLAQLSAWVVGGLESSFAALLRIE